MSNGSVSVSNPASPPVTSTTDDDSSEILKALEARLAELETGSSSIVSARPKKSYVKAGGLAAREPDQNAWDRSRKECLPLQGGSLKTWSFASAYVERVQVVLKSEGRPLDADIELWQGPDNTPQKVRVYSEDGNLRPFRAVIATPRAPNTVAIRNTGHLEFPMAVSVAADDGSAGPIVSEETGFEPPLTIQGGALRTYPFDPFVESVQIMIKTDGRPLNARIELLQGPNNNKQVIEIYCEDGRDRPFYAVIETPGSGNVVRVVNTATVEFPMTAWVVPYMVSDGGDLYEQPVIGGDPDAFMSRGSYGTYW